MQLIYNTTRRGDVTRHIRRRDCLDAETRLVPLCGQRLYLAEPLKGALSDVECRACRRLARQVDPHQQPV